MATSHVGGRETIKRGNLADVGPVEGGTAASRPGERSAEGEAMEATLGVKIMGAAVIVKTMGAAVNVETMQAKVGNGTKEAAAGVGV